MFQFYTGKVKWVLYSEETSEKTGVKNAIFDTHFLKNLWSNSFNIWTFTHWIVMQNRNSCRHQFFTLLDAPLDAYLVNLFIVLAFLNLSGKVVGHIYMKTMRY